MQQVFGWALTALGLLWAIEVLVLIVGLALAGEWRGRSRSDSREAAHTEKAVA